MFNKLAKVVASQQNTLDDLKREITDYWSSKDQPVMKSALQWTPEKDELPDVTQRLSDALDSQHNTIVDLKRQITKCRGCGQNPTQPTVINQVQKRKDVDYEEDRFNDNNLLLVKSPNLSAVIELQQNTIDDLKRQVTDYKESVFGRNYNQQSPVINQVLEHQGEEPEHVESDIKQRQRRSFEKGFSAGFTKACEQKKCYTKAQNIEKDQLHFANKNQEVDVNADDDPEGLENEQVQFEGFHQTSEKSGLEYGSSSSIPPSLPDLELDVKQRAQVETEDFTRQAAPDQRLVKEDRYRKGFQRGFARGFVQGFE